MKDKAKTRFNKVKILKLIIFLNAKVLSSNYVYFYILKFILKKFNFFYFFIFFKLIFFLIFLDHLNELI